MHPWRAYKRLVNCCDQAPLQVAIDLETELFGPIWISQDHDEAVRAMFENRSATFIGK